MKIKKIKTFVAVICSICVFYGIFPSYIAFAEETENNNIIIEGNADGLVTIPNKDEFLTKKDMLPGDEVKGKILLRNQYDYPYEIYIRAEDREKLSDSNFLEKLILNVSIDDDIIYKGSLDGGETMSNDIYLGTINPGESLTLDASVTLDGRSTGNEFKNKYASIDWIFTASRTEVLGEKEIDDPEPSGVLGEIETIIKTGDKFTKIIIPLGILSVSALVILVINMKRRERKDA